MGKQKSIRSKKHYWEEPTEPPPSEQYPHFEQIIPELGRDSRAFEAEELRRMGYTEHGLSEPFEMEEGSTPKNGREAGRKVA